jgi:hypothetical protein
MLMSITIDVICHVVSHMRETTLRDPRREDICRRPKVPLDAHPAMPLVTHGARGVSTDGANQPYDVPAARRPSPALLEPALHVEGGIDVAAGVEESEYPPLKQAARGRPRSGWECRTRNVQDVVRRALSGPREQRIGS